MRRAGPLLTALLLALLIAGSGAHARAQDSAAPAASFFEDGIDALASHLWEVAETRFRRALEDPELEPERRAEILLRLAESQVRGGRSEAALETLAEPVLAEDPARPYWTAQALAGLGRLTEAIAALHAGALDPGAPHLGEAMLSKAGLQRALGDPQAALATIERRLRDFPSSPRNRLLKAEILLDQGDPAAALETLPADASLTGQAAGRAAYLRARAQLDSGDIATAIAGFEALLENPEGQPLRLNHAATLGLAQAHLSSGERARAGDTLLAFIQQNPDSPLLEQAFGLLLECLPESPAPNDAILTRMREWIPTPPPPPPAAVAATNGAVSSWPSATTASAAASRPLAPEALFHLAVGLRREGSTESLQTARSLLNRLRLSYPKHPLSARALLTLGRWNLADGRPLEAAACLEAVAELGDGAPASLRAQALSLEGARRFADGNFAAAAAAFRRVTGLVDGPARAASRLNAGTALLAGGQLAAFAELSSEVDDPTLATSLALERALFLSSFRDPEALPTLKSFINLHPDHPRIHEARLAAALAALDAIPPDTGFAATQLALLDTEARQVLPAASLALADIRLHEHLDEPDEAAAAAVGFLEAHPDDPRRLEIVFELGRAYFQGGNYHDARLQLETLATEHPDNDNADAALLISARAAALSATPQARAESIALFDQLIDRPTPFTDLARLEKADLLVTLARLDEATETLLPWFQRIEADDPLLLPVGLLLSDALVARAEGRPEELLRAVEVHDRLLADLPEGDPGRHRVLFEKGLNLEQVPGREEDAVEAYYSVLESAANTTGGDWQAIEGCGFKAVSILEKAKRWRAAIAIAESIAKLGGPRAGEAAERAKAIRGQQFIWED